MGIEDHTEPTLNGEQYARKQRAMTILSVSGPTIDRLVKAGKLPRYKLGSRISLYKLSDLQALVKSPAEEAYS